MTVQQKLNGKIALITGASRGIGAAIAKRFAQEGAHVILAARTIKDLEQVDSEIQAKGGTATIVPLDMADGAKIDELGYVLYKRYGYLDIVVGNAAILGTLSPLPHIKPEIWEQVLNINLTANWRLIRSMDPLLRLSKQGRAIFVTSSVATELSPYWGTYAISKAALEMLAKLYAAEVAITNIKCNLIDPGTVATNVLAQAMPGQDLNELIQPDDITDLFVALASDECTSSGEIFQCDNLGGK